jgi:multisubunit Na+/H+ antiporter MnhB subunit
MKSSWRRHFCFFVLGALSPWVGLQLLLFVAVASVLLLLYLGRETLPTVIVTLVGAVAGVVSLALLYISYGVLDGFWRSIKQHTSVGVVEVLASGHFRHSNFIPKDFSFLILFVLAVALAVYQMKNNTFKRKSILSFGLVYSVALSVALVAGGKFPTYYGWMTYVPLSVCLCSMLSDLAANRKLHAASLILIWGAIAVGVSLNLMAAAYDWKDRDYENVEKLVRENITNTDWVFGELATYYAVKPRAAPTFTTYYLPAMLSGEKSRINVLVIAPNNFEAVTKAIGGHWLSTEKKFVPQRSGFLGTKLDLGILTRQNYHLEVYRRTDASPPTLATPN